MKKFLFFCCTFLLMYSWCFAGKTEAFFAAVRNGNSSQVERMLEKDKTLVFLKDRNGMTPFLLAVQTRNLKMTDLLSEYFARLNDSDDINQRLAMHYDIKQKIAGAACQLIENGETVMVESGSCCALLALEIAKTKKDVTIITNSAFIGEYIRKSGDCKIVLLGGQYQREAQVMVGPMTRKCAELFFVDKLFIGIDGFMAESGFTGNDFMRCEVVRDMAKQANTVIVVSDSSKFSQKGTVRLLTMSEVSYVFTDDEILPEHEQILIESGIQVVKVKKD